MQRIADCISEWVASSPDQPAISDDHYHWTYTELDLHIRQAVQYLRSLGVGPGDRVVLIGENSATLAALILATGCLDAWAVLENARRAAMEVDAVCKHAHPRVIIHVVDNSPAAREHAQRNHAVSTETPFGLVAASPVDPTSQPEPVHLSGADQVGVLIYTTGTTGVPKGVMITHANLLHIGRQMQQERRLTPDDRVYGVLPITHVMGLASGLLGTLSSGARIKMVARFDRERCIQSLREDGITILQGAPAMFARLAQGCAPMKSPGPGLRVIAAGGAPLDAGIKKKVEAVFGMTLHNGYGLTEGSGVCWTRLDDDNQDCSVGPPNPGMELRICDKAGKPVAPGEVGELWIRGPCIMKGYYKMPELTREVLAPGGWFNSQDLAWQAPDGRIHIHGRSKELIIRSGFNVSPLEVETALNTHELVQYSAVLGHTKDGNEQIIAVIEPKANATLCETELKAYLADRLSPYKRPSRIIFMDNLPVAPNGKVLKQQLMQKIGEIL
ncbi:class I adenylate-forming enzyme family protein [Pusillimonas sp. SM2304]|uniref:class I adenylate-forming enzyme family protein n=1 Tax=Pusillimonas sp. SM2304 TaxID=3073241 RepID=UPI00287418F7|nr:class I adenylate-forming enzyme family protein [Pusillimonas sp. SM2304]MDS1139468.1 class I adenylate-forming enzyme family protein [Pusillimonas sp. SM2304]